MSADHWVRDCYLTLVFAWFLLFLAILVHEWAHWACARWLGFAASRVVIGLGPAFLRMRWRGATWHFQLIPLLGFVRYLTWRDPSPGRQILVALAGPAANLGLATVLFAILPTWHPGAPTGYGPLALFALAADAYAAGPAAMLSLFAFSNLGMGLFNLLPFPPLDGSTLIAAPAQALHRASPDSFSANWWSRAWSYAGLVVIVAIHLLVLFADFPF